MGERELIIHEGIHAPTDPQQAVDAVKRQMNVITTCHREIMTDGQDFGTIPGCGDKPTLLKPGAEKIIAVFGLRPLIKDIKVAHLENGHREITVITSLETRGGGIIAEGVGSCSSMESKYRYRKSAAKVEVLDDPIPNDYRDKKADYRKRGFGCKQIGGEWKWVRYLDGEQDRVENPDLADQYNTILKMAKKRSLIDAVLTGTGASTIFTQDIEDLKANEEAATEKPPVQPAPVKQPPIYSEKEAQADCARAAKNMAAQECDSDDLDAALGTKPPEPAPVDLAAADKKAEISHQRSLVAMKLEKWMEECGVTGDNAEKLRHTWVETFYGVAGLKELSPHDITKLYRNLVMAETPKAQEYVAKVRNWIKLQAHLFGGEAGQVNQRGRRRG